MLEQSGHTVVRCEKCAKPFDNKSSLKRHGYYCRSRSQPSKSRRRSCLTCVAIKARCDSGRPACSRCSRRNTECLYSEGSTSQAGSVATDHQTSSATEDPPISPSAVTHAPSAIGEPNTAADPTLAPLWMDELTWDFSANPFFDLLNSSGTGGTAHTSLPISPTAKQQTIPPLPFIELIQLGDMAPVIPRSPDMLVRSLVRRPQVMAQRQGNTKLMFITLKSYLSKIRHTNSMPPFIHQSIITGFAGIEPSEFLNNAIALLRMLGGEVLASRRLFWQNVRMECQYMCSKCSSLTDWQLLGSLQALTLYILVRLEEGEVEHNNLDSLLINTITIIRTEVNIRYFGTVSKPNTPAANWRQWLYEETARRVCLIHQILDLLVYFEPVTLCNRSSRMVLAPLPRSMMMWNATSLEAWQSEQNTLGTPLYEYGIGLDGNLLGVQMAQSDACWDKLGGQELRSSSGQLRTWEDWSAVMDGFGGLVLLVASLYMS